MFGVEIGVIVTLIVSSTGYVLNVGFLMSAPFLYDDGAMEVK